MNTITTEDRSTPAAAQNLLPWRSLHTQFLHKLLWPLVFAFLLAAGITAATNYREGVKQQAQWREQMISTFGNSLLKPLWDCDDATAKGIVQTLSQMPMVQGVSLQDLCANDTHAIGNINLKTIQESTQQKAALPHQLQSPLLYKDETAREFTVGHLTIQFEPVSIWQVFSRRLGEQITVFAAILGAMFTVVILVFRHTIERPLSRLHQAMLHQQTVHGSQPPVRKLRDELTDVTDVYDQLLKELQSQAQHDVLTGLGNRKLLEQQLELAVAHASDAREDKHGYVMLLDLDGFKPINDTYGHAAGDYVLQAIAQRLRNVTRSEDTVTRLGGDEFVIVSTNFPGDEGMSRILSRIAQTVEEPLSFNGQTLQVGASVGYARIPQDGITSESLLSHADQAMYMAKQVRKSKRALAPTEAS